MTQKKKTKSRAGRPTKYKKEYCQGLIDHMSQGWGFETYAAVINVNPDTLYEWAKVHPEFSEAKKVAFVKSQMKFEQIGMAAMLGKIKNFQPSVWVFTMKNRFGWSDSPQTPLDEMPDGFSFDFEDDE